MKKGNHINLMASELNPRFTQLALVGWKLINNNIITAPMYFIFQIADFVIQILLITSIYDATNIINFSFKAVSEAIRTTNNPNTTLYSLLIAFGYCFIILISIIIMLIRSQSKKRQQQQLIFAKTVAVLFTLIRTFVFTIFTVFLAVALPSIYHNELNRYLLIFLECSTILQLWILTYFQIHFFNLCIPNMKIPWSETNSNCFLIECLFKFSLSMGFTYQDYVPLRYTFIGMGIICMVYKLLLRIKRSFIFNRLINNFSMIADSVLLYLLFMVFPGYIIQNDHFYIYILVVLPAFLLLLWYLVLKFKIQRSINSFEDLKNDADRLIAYCQILQYYSKDNDKHFNKFSQLKYQHYLQCRPYGRRLEGKLLKKYNKRMAKIQASQKNQGQGAGEYEEEDNFYNSINGTFNRSTIIIEEVKNNTISVPSPIIRNTNNPSFRQVQNEMGKGMTINSSTVFHKQQSNIRNSYKNLGFQSTQFTISSNYISAKTKHQSKKAVQFKDIPEDVFRSQFTQIASTEVQQKPLNLKQRIGNFAESLFEWRQKRDLNEMVSKNKKNQEKDIKRLLKHMFKNHFIVDSQNQDFRLQLLKAHFTIQVLHNQYLAHFIMFEYINKSEKDGIILRNKKLLHQKYFESLIQNENLKDTEVQSINLQVMLDLNQLLAKFESSLEKLTEDIMKFWTNLLNDKGGYQLYEKGLAISKEVNDFTELYEDIDRKQFEKNEIKLYIQMAAFYKYLIFKHSEYEQQMIKSRQVIQNRQVINEKLSQNTTEKGLVLAKLDLKKPMQIEFLNKQACRIIQYEKEQALGLKINAIMPQIISENHLKFIERFMSSGVNRVLNIKRKLYIKRRNRYILPVNIYLSINFLDLQSMILLIEQVSEHETEIMGEQEYSGLILTDSNNRIQEISKQCLAVCKLSYSVIEHYRQQYGRFPTLEDLFKNESSNEDIETLLSQGINEFDVTVRYAEYTNKSIENFNDEAMVEQEEEEKKEDEGAYTPKRRNNAFDSKDIPGSNVGLKRSTTSVIRNANIADVIYTLNISTEQFMNKSLEMRVVQIKITQNQQSLTNTFHFNSTLAPNRGDDIKTLQGKDLILEDIILTTDNKGSVDEVQEKFMDLSSQTSTSSTISSIINKFSLDSTSIESKKLPSTLKFVLQIFMIVLFLVLATSTVSLVLISSNFKDAWNGIQMSYLSIQRLNAITQMRLLMRVLVNIAEGYNYNSNEVLSDRCAFYTDMVEEQLEQLRLFQNDIDSKDSVIQQQIGDVTLETMTAMASFEFIQRSISQSVTLYLSYGNDLIQIIRNHGGCKALFSWLVYFWIPVLDRYQADTKEREMYFIIQNGNQDLFYKLNKYAEEYIRINSEKIANKVYFSTMMTWVCIGIILICGLLILPLFGRIQNRVLALMIIFFTIDKDVKKYMLQKIHQFNDIMFSHSKSQLHPHDLDETKNIEGSKQSGSTPEDNLADANGERKFVSKRRSSRHFINKFVDHGIQQNKEEFLKGQMNRQKIAQPLNLYEIKEEPSKEEDKESISSIESGEEQHRKNLKSHIKKQQQQEKQLIVSQQPLMKQFKQIIQKKKLIQSLMILLLMVSFQSYFLGTYLMSSQSFATMSESVDVVFILFQRKACSEDIVHAVVEGYQWNDTYFINHGKDEIMEYFIGKCGKLESDYQQKVLQSRPIFLSEAQSYLDLLEKGNFCDKVFEDGDGFKISTVTPQKCKSFVGGITQLGLTNIFQTTFKICQQLQISYQNAFDNGGDRGPDVIYGGIKAASVYLDVIESILTKPINKLNDLVMESIETYFASLSMNFNILFACFISFTFIVSIVFIFSKHYPWFHFVQEFFEDLKQR